MDTGTSPEGRPFGDFRLGEWIVKPRLNRLGGTEGSVSLEPKLMDVLVVLARRPRQVVSKDELLAAVWPEQFIGESILSRAIAELRRQLGDDARNPTYIETIPKRGYRLIGAVTPLAESPATAARRGADAERPSGRKSRWLWGSLLVAALLGTAVLVLTSSRRAAAPPGLGAAGRTAVAVLYFENHSPAAEARWLSKGLPGMLTTSLAQTPGLDVVSSERLYEALSEVGQADLETVDKRLVAEIARRTGAGAVVVGSLFQSGDEIQIDVRVEDVGSGRILTAHRVRGDDVFPLVDELAARIRASLELADRPAGRPIAEVTTSSLEAYRTYSEAVEARRNIRLNDARERFEEAVSIDPSFAMAYAQLAEVVGWWGEMALVRHYREKVLENLERLPERQRLLFQARYLVGQEEGRAKAAELLETLIARYPDEEEAHTLLASIYRELGRPERALGTLRRAEQTLPASGPIRMHLGYTWLMSGDLDEAERELEAYARLSPDEPNPYDSLGELYLVSGRPERALEEYARALEADPSYWFSHLGRSWSYAVAGRFEEALSALDEARALGEAAASPDVPAEVELSRNLWSFRRAFLLSRAGRYREADAEIARGLEGARASASVERQVSLELLAALLEIERGNYPAALERAERARERIPQVAGRRFFHWPLEVRKNDLEVVALLLSGVSEARRGRLGAARAHLARVEALSDGGNPRHRWWSGALEGEIALAEGDLTGAELAFSAGEPRTRMWFNASVPVASVFANDLPWRDGLARVKAARGDLAGAVALYRELLAPERSKWVAVLEPCYVLELARLLERTGDEKGARLERRRFEELWKNADRDPDELVAACRHPARKESEDGGAYSGSQTGIRPGV